MSLMSAEVLKVSQPDARQAVYADLMVSAAGRLNDRFFAQMLSSWALGGGALPHQLGLSDRAFSQLISGWFNKPLSLFYREKTRLDPARAPEMEDLRKLLLDDRAGRDDSERWVAEIVCAGCLASDHLWSDLGLFSRPALTQMLSFNFPALAARNDRNMKWKKFFYKQLCAQEGIYVCRAPSCETCADYAKCFIEGE